MTLFLNLRKNAMSTLFSWGQSYIPSNHQKMVLGPRDHRCGVVKRSHGLAVTEADDDAGPLFRHQFLDDFSMFLVRGAPGDLR